MKNTSCLGDAMITGLALFAMFFGAGNLIFPPYLGMTTGEEWFTGFFLYFLMDAGLAFTAIIAMINGDGYMEGVTGVIGKWPSLLLNTSIILCIGPLLATSRTAALSFEMISNSIWPGINSILFTFFYFLLVLIFSIRPSKVTDTVGRFLTPVLVMALLLLIVAGVFSPLGEIGPARENVVKEGIINGYQTLDLFGALGFALIICATIKSKGYVQGPARMRVVIPACLVAGALLFVVYCGLAYLGATCSSLPGVEGVKRADLLAQIASGLLGNFGASILCLLVGFACLTTAIGLTAANAHYFETISNGRLPYRAGIVVISLLSLIIANFGLETIINIAVPILLLVYPVTITLVILSLFRNKIRNINIYRGSVLVVFIVSLFSVARSNGLLAEDPFSWLPLYQYEMQWILPAILGALAGKLINFRSAKTES